MLEFLQRVVRATRKRQREEDEASASSASAPPAKRQRFHAPAGEEWFLPCMTSAPLVTASNDGTASEAETVAEEGGEHFFQCMDQGGGSAGDSIVMAVDQYLKACKADPPQGLKKGKKRRKKKRKKKKQQQQQQQDEEAEQPAATGPAGSQAPSGSSGLDGIEYDLDWPVVRTRRPLPPLKGEEEEADPDGDDGEGEGEVAEDATVSFGKRIYEDDPNRPADAPLKYWAQRLRFFSRFNEGIRIDAEGWYSVTPEEIAKHTAERCACDVIVDAFCGVGGNTIQFAMTCNRVIAIDNNEERLRCAQHNARVYGVADRIDFILGDYFDIIQGIKADVVFLSPPWGGPEYMDSDVFDIHNMGGMDGTTIMRYALKASHNVALFLPRNVNSVQVLELAPEQQCELEGNFLNAKLKTVTAYYGDLIAQPDEAEGEEEY